MVLYLYFLSSNKNVWKFQVSTRLFSQQQVTDTVRVPLQSMTVSKEFHFSVLNTCFSVFEHMFWCFWTHVLVFFNTCFSVFEHMFWCFSTHVLGYLRISATTEQDARQRSAGGGAQLLRRGNVHLTLNPWIPNWASCSSNAQRSTNRIPESPGRVFIYL